MNLREEVKSRNLPPLKSRKEMVEIIQRELFGYLPNPKFEYSVSEPTDVESRYGYATVTMSYVTMTIKIGEKSHSFRVDRLLHTDGKKRPLVIVNNFHQMMTEIKGQYFPIEEMAEYDVNYLYIYYEDITSDDGDFSTGLAPMLLPNGQDTDTTCGKIGIWAWANMRVMDYAQTLDCVDKSNICICGHSRLGKTSLFTGMMDERFKFVFSNAAGCAGDSLAHGNSGFAKRGQPTYDRGELIEDIVRNFPYWFCKNYHKYAKDSISNEFDQHFLVASIAPRYVLIGSCEDDAWADQHSQQLCALAASEAWEKAGLTGLVNCDKEYVRAGEGSIDGHVGFFMIKGRHYLSRHSWKWCIDFIIKHKND